MATGVARRFFASTSPNSLRILPSVQDALQHGRPVVALESTILAHGIPYPDNTAMARNLATLLRNQGVEPATIAIRNGQCCVGLDVEELEHLCSPTTQSHKCSTRDMGWALSTTAANNSWGATTVASTLQIAHMAGISVFVTGGMGGVHRSTGNGVQDVSADIAALARIPVLLVSAGIKSILDIRNTLEALETNEVPVVAYQTNDFPAFYSPTSGIQAPMRMDTPAEVARAFHAHRDQLDLPSGMMLAVPNPDAVAGDQIEQAIQQALREANEQVVEGRDATPFVLRRVVELTGGASLRSNLALVEQNARVGAEIAVAMAELQSATTMMAPSVPRETSDTQRQALVPSPRVVVFGGAVLDLVAKPNDKLRLGTSNQASCHETDGGVARNVAEVLGRLGSKPVLCSAVGEDARGKALMNRLEQECGVTHVQETMQVVPNARTSTYIAILDQNGDLHTACADMDVIHEANRPTRELLATAEIVVMDANPSIDVLCQCAKEAVECGAKVFFEPTSVAKAVEASNNEEFLSYLTYASPNQDEFLAMAGNLSHTDFESLKVQAESFLQTKMKSKEAHLIITCGENGVLLASKREYSQVSLRHYPAEEGVHVQNATGAGDTLTGACVHALLKSIPIEDAVSFGMEAASLSLGCYEKTISPALSTLAIR